jgi:hypothetical protein
MQVIDEPPIVRISGQRGQIAALSAGLAPRQWIDRVGDSFELGRELPRVVRRKHHVRAVTIDMPLASNPRITLR